MTNRSHSEAPPWTILKLLRWTTDYFKSHHIENPRASAEILLSHLLGTARIDLYVRYDQPLMESELASFKTLIKRRVRREPVAYIVGEKEFWSMGLRVTPAVLIPRPETECLVEAALHRLDRDKSKRILDAGTGSGAVALALNRERPGNTIIASDRSREALAVARGNAIRHEAAESIAFFCGDWFEAIRPAVSNVDLIISNPPYIRTADLARLEPEVRAYEPKG
ncbi:MAG: peptide chain release factor N(5)-glutamine methyltransferase, partial [Thermodesulfobacteriota bacterium]